MFVSSAFSQDHYRLYFNIDSHMAQIPIKFVSNIKILTLVCLKYEQVNVKS